MMTMLILKMRTISKPCLAKLSSFGMMLLQSSHDDDDDYELGD